MTPLPPLPFSEYPDSARVWIYQTGQMLTGHENLLAEKLDAFTQTWKSHGAEVRGSWALYGGGLVLVAADEEQAGVSGCSTDGLVRIMQELSATTGQDFFNRTSCGLFGPEGLVFAPLPEVKKGHLPAPAEVLYYADPTPTHLRELRAGWPVLLTQSWIPVKTPVVL